MTRRVFSARLPDPPHSRLGATVERIIRAITRRKT